MINNINLVTILKRNLQVICPFVFGLFLSVSQWAFCAENIVGGLGVLVHDGIQETTVALFKKSAEGGFLCTASLISESVALTAAHCIPEKGEQAVLVFGRNIRGKDIKVAPVADVLTPKTWHGASNTAKDQGDIALLQFEGGLPNGYHPAELLSEDVKLENGETVVLAGFGINDAKEKTGAGVLRKTEVQIAKTHLGKTEIVFDQTHGSGACHGDSGGPAFLVEKGIYYLFGVANRSYPGRAPDDCAHQVVYTQVNAYRGWIEDGMRKLKEQEAHHARRHGR